MKITVIFAAVIGASMLLAGCSHHHVATTASGKTVYGDKAATIDRLNDSAADLKELVNAPDAGIPKEVLESAKCIAVVPDMVKGGFVFGARHGLGVATCRTGQGWSDPAFFAVTGGSWGAQIGLESVDIVMLAMNEKGMQDMLSSEFKLGAGASIAAGPIGREAQASTDWKFKSEILMYSRARGLFAGIDLSGAAIKPDGDSTVAFYGKPIDSSTILSGRGPSNANAKPFLASVKEAVQEARSGE
ncbi:MAG: YSC84-related protein [Terriglobales bacterium]